MKKNYLLIIFIIIQTIFYIITGCNKEYIHIDEAYSFGLCNYERVEITDNSDFYNNWHSKEYYGDYLTIQEDEKGDFTPVYENQKNDVHPPLYYLLLRIAMELANGQFSIWTGIILNIIIYVFITVFMYLILKKLLKDSQNSNIKASILAFMSSITLASLSNAIYIRMYALLTLEIIITLYFHIKLLESKEINYKLLIIIGITVLAGILTHYYYIFYLFFLYLVFFERYIKEKNLRKLSYYTITVLISGIISLIIFPYSIQHMFFGYRGQGVIDSLINIRQTAENIFTHIYNLNYYGFNGLMYAILGIIIIIILYNKVRKRNMTNMSKENKVILEIICTPTILFFIIVSIASPWKNLRYIVPICGITFVIAVYLLYELLKTIFSEKTSNILVMILFCLILISPFALKLEPELLYKGKGEILEKLSRELNLPSLYTYKPGNDGFLNNIELFSVINESYIAKDIQYTEENIQEILRQKDTSEGIIVFISEGEDAENILKITKNATGLETSQYLKKLDYCNVYYVR